MAERAPDAGLAVVLTTLPSQEAADVLARTLVQERLAACGSVIPGVTSVYRWEGAVVSESEVLVLLKTPPELVASLMERAARLHPYEVPELVALPADAVSQAYGRWVRLETTEVSP